MWAMSRSAASTMVSVRFVAWGNALFEQAVVGTQSVASGSGPEQYVGGGGTDTAVSNAELSAAYQCRMDSSLIGSGLLRVA
jgi:hypothetical protein